MLKRFMILCGLFFVVSPATAESNHDLQVDVEIVLAVDVSGSMNSTELRIQRQGYVEALRSDDVWAAIESGLIGSVAVMYVEWARADLKKVIVPWSKISTRVEAHRFADRLMVAEFENMRNTSITGAIAYGITQLERNKWLGLRRVIDISGDGPNNQGGLVTRARDDAVKAGIVINGLPIVVTQQMPAIGGFNGDLAEYYRICVTGGPGSFVIPVTTWEEFGEAVRRKLVLELAGTSDAFPIVDAAYHTHIEYDCQIGERLRRLWLEP